MGETSSPLLLRPLLRLRVQRLLLRVDMMLCPQVGLLMVTGNALLPRQEATRGAFCLFCLLSISRKLRFLRRPSWPFSPLCAADTPMGRL